MLEIVFKLAAPLAAAGVVIGVAAAAFGIGGGVLNVPIVYFILRGQGVPDGPAFKSALATSMFAMFFTSLSAGLGHYQKRNYIAGAVLWLAAGSILGAQAGAAAAIYIKGEALKKLFGALLLFLALRLGAGRAEPGDGGDSAPRSPAAALAAVGLATGAFGALMGVGGGIVVIPLLSLVLGHPFHKAVGTSSILIIFTSASAFARYMLGAPAVDLPYSIGYVNWLVAAVLAPGCMIGARLGVPLMLRVDPRPLRRVFALMVAAVALKLLGAFQMLAGLFS